MLASCQGLEIGGKFAAVNLPKVKPGGDEGGWATICSTVRRPGLDKQWRPGQEVLRKPNDWRLGSHLGMNGMGRCG